MEPTSAEKNEAIAKSHQPKQDDWMWESCPVKGHSLLYGLVGLHCFWEGQEGSADEVRERLSGCPHCHGTGKVAVDLHENRYTLMLANLALEREGDGDHEPLHSALAQLFDDFIYGPHDETVTGLAVRDIIYDTLKDHSDG